MPAGGVLRITTGAPANSTVFGNLTITQPTNLGWAVAYPCNEPRPWASNINFAAGQTVANFVGVKTDADGAFCVFTTSDAHVLFDRSAATSALPLSAPQRVIDTRTPQGGGMQVPAGGVLTVVTPGAPYATAWGNLTVTGAQHPGWVVAYPCDQPRPWASNVNFAAGANTANFVAVRTDGTGSFCVYSSVAVHVIFDQVGSSDVLAAEVPQRMIDTREAQHGAAVVPAGGVVEVSTTAGAATTVWGNLTATGASAAGWLVAYPCDQPRPTASNVNFPAGRTVANFVAVRTDDRGKFCVYSSVPSHVIFDQSQASDVVAAESPVRTRDTRSDWSGPSQLITVRVETKTSQQAQVGFWQRGQDGKFRAARGPVSGWVGELGIGQGQWGVARTPEGYYAMTEAFGILSNPGTKMPYFKVDNLDWWDGDPNSPTYNTHVRKTWVPGAGSEHLIDFGYAYYYAAAFDYNPERNPAKGSAFFFHVSTNEPTGGCISVPIADIKAMLQAMDPDQHPVITIGLQGWGTALVDRTHRP